VVAGPGPPEQWAEPEQLVAPPSWVQRMLVSARQGHWVPESPAEQCCQTLRSPLVGLGWDSAEKRRHLRQGE